jgi:hypothetical protein
MKRSTANVLHGVLTVVFGFVLLGLVADIFDTMNWPMFHSWGMAHGAIIYALPVCLAVAFALLYSVRRLLSRKDGFLSILETRK